MERIEHLTITTNGINIHVATIGSGPAILFLHGFPELWYSWRHQILSLSARGYRCIAPDLRGYGDSDAPPSPASYTAHHVVGDLVGLLDHLGIDQAFLVGHDWGAFMAWHFCLFRPDRVKALVNLSVPFYPRHPTIKFIQGLRACYGDDFYMCRFQEPGEAEEDFASEETETILKKLYKSFGGQPPCIPKEIGFRGLKAPETLPSRLSQEDVTYCATKFSKKGFTGGLNYYRAVDITWELTAPWIGAQVKVPTKFVVGDQDCTYHFPGVQDYIHKGNFKRDVPLLEEVVVLEGVPHFINQVKPDEISNHIYDFVKKYR